MSNYQEAKDYIIALIEQSLKPISGENIATITANSKSFEEIDRILNKLVEEKAIKGFSCGDRGKESVKFLIWIERNETQV